MILIVCTDDANLTAIAQHSANGNPAVFGHYYQAFGHQVPLLGVHEDLFIIAHGAYHGDDGNPVIGDQAAAFYVNAVELYQNIAHIFPQGYTGNVYIDACESADGTAYTFSFTEVFLTQIHVHFGQTAVYGRNGAAGGLIPLPGSAGWVRAHL